nr:hypothetical protein [Cupriavidus necator]
MNALMPSMASEFAAQRAMPSRSARNLAARAKPRSGLQSDLITLLDEADA